MHPIGRVVFAGLAVFVVWTLVRACRSGTIFSRDIAFRLHEQPVLFSLAFTVHVLIALFLVWCAAGNDPGAFFRVLGIPL